MPRIIYLVGPAGAGKTTNAMLLRYYLHKYYNRCVLPEIRSKDLLGGALARFLMRVGRVEYDVRPEGRALRMIDSVFISRVYDLWILLEFAGFIMTYFIKVLPAYLFGCDVALNRFLIDFLTDMVLLSERAGKSFRLVSTLAYVFLRPMYGVNAIFYLDGEYAELHKRYYIRKGDIIEPPWKVAKFRAISKLFFNMLYKYADGYLDLLYIDTTHMSLRQVFNQIFNKVRRFYEMED